MMSRVFVLAVFCAAAVESLRSRAVDEQAQAREADGKSATAGFFGGKTSANATAGQPLMDMVNSMRAEKCADKKFGVSDEYDECLEFMTGQCKPGPDMLMNGSPGEVTFGKGHCADFFNDYKAHQPGGNAAVAPVGGGESFTGSVLRGDAEGDSDDAEANYPEADDRAVAGTEEMQDVMEEVGELMRSRSSSADEMKEDLAALNWYEDELQSKIDALNEDEYCRQVEKESVLVGQETSAPEMAEMLADMRCEMHRYSMPFYTKLLQKKLDEVKDEQKELVLKIEARKQENRTKAVEDVVPSVAPSKSEKKTGAESKVQAPRQTIGVRTPVRWYEWLLVLCFLSACIVGCFFFGKRRDASP